MLELYTSEKGYVMREDLRDLQKSLESEINDTIEDIIYEVERYQKECSLALIHSLNNIDTDKIKEVARKSDIVVKVGGNTVFIIYPHTPEWGAIKATEKILFSLNPNCKSKIYASVVGCLPHTTKAMLIRHIFNLIDFSIDNDHENEVIDISYLHGIY